MFTCNLQTQIPKKPTLFASHKLFPSKNNNKKRDDILHCKFLSSFKIEKGKQTLSCGQTLSQELCPFLLCSCSLGNSSPFPLWFPLPFLPSSPSSLCTPELIILCLQSLALPLPCPCHSGHCRIFTPTGHWALWNQPQARPKCLTYKFLMLY